MAADTRPFKSKEQDGQGNDIIIRDQQLVEQTSQTTMASGEYFEIVDVDGRMAKIPKDNMIGVVREALGTLLNGLADQTTVTKALTLNGDTLGASTAATLASVLGAGGQFAQADSTINANDILTNMALYYATGNAAQQNVPVQYFLFVTLVSSISSKDRVQFGIAISGATMYVRSYNGSNWTAWKQLANVS